MPEYIEREALTIENLEKYMTVMEVNTKEYGQQVVVAVDDLMYLPTADVVEVVRCKDCEHWGGVIYGFVCRKFSGIETKICMHADDFCSYGKRKEVKNA